MKTRNFIILAIWVLVMILTGCTVQKRIYRPGYHIEWHKNYSNSNKSSQKNNMSLKKVEKQSNDKSELSYLKMKFVNDSIFNYFVLEEKTSNYHVKTENNKDELVIINQPIQEDSLETIKKGNDVDTTEDLIHPNTKKTTKSFLFAIISLLLGPFSFLVFYILIFYTIILGATLYKESREKGIYYKDQNKAETCLTISMILFFLLGTLLVILLFETYFVFLGIVFLFPVMLGLLIMASGTKNPSFKKMKKDSIKSNQNNELNKKWHVLGALAYIFMFVFSLLAGLSNFYFLGFAIIFLVFMFLIIFISRKIKKDPSYWLNDVKYLRLARITLFSIYLLSSVLIMYLFWSLIISNPIFIIITGIIFYLPFFIVLIVNIVKFFIQNKNANEQVKGKLILNKTVFALYSFAIALLVAIGIMSYV